MVFPLIWGLGLGITSVVGVTTSYIANRLTEQKKEDTKQAEIEAKRELELSKIPENQAVLATESKWDDFFLFLRQNTALILIFVGVALFVFVGVKK